MVKIVKQPKFSFWKYREIYQFDLPSRSHNPLDQILEFYTKAAVRNLKAESHDIHFSRGSIKGSLFSPSECRHQQDVSIQIFGRQVTCEYHCFNPYPSPHIPPSRLYREVQQLEDFLKNSSSEKKYFRKSFFVLNPVYRLLYFFYRLFSGSRHRLGRRLTR